MQYDHSEATTRGTPVNIVSHPKRLHELPKQHCCRYHACNSSLHDSEGGDNKGNNCGTTHHASTYHRKNPFTKHIIDNIISKSMEKPLNLENYVSFGDPNKHVESMYIILDYHIARSAMKCKFFVLTLKRVVMKWFKAL